MKIEETIKDWDGKSVDDMTAVYDHWGDDPAFLSKIISLISEDACQKGASWLLKRYVEDHGCLSSKESNQIYRLLKKLDHWETKLHLLQCMPYLPIAKSHVKRVESFLRVCLVDQNKFVRAWAYNGFYELALQHSQFQSEAKQLMEKAMQDEAASVKARIRNIMKQGF